MEESMSVSHSRGSTFSDEPQPIDDDDASDVDTIDYDGLGNDSSHGTNGGYPGRRVSHEKKTKKKTEDKSMLANGKKISNTFRWKLFVIFLMFVNTSIVVIATSVYLNNDASREFERAVSQCTWGLGRSWEQVQAIVFPICHGILTQALVGPFLPFSSTMLP